MQLEELNAEHNSQIDSAHGLSNAQIAADKSKAEELQQKFGTELAEQSDKHAREIDVMVEAMRRQQEGLEAEKEAMVAASAGKGWQMKGSTDHVSRIGSIEASPIQLRTSASEANYPGASLPSGL